jgi:large conductance mechanosensitive channel
MEDWMLKEFREFAMRGNVLDLAVGIIIGAAFGTIVKSLVDDIIMPPVGLLLGGVDPTNLFVLLRAGKTPPPYATLADAKAAGAVTMNYGAFLSTIITFLIVAFSVFLLVRAINSMRRAPAAAPTTKPCTFCAMEIPIGATRCPHCTSQLA